MEALGALRYLHPGTGQGRALPVLCGSTVVVKKNHTRSQARPLRRDKSLAIRMAQALLKPTGPAYVVEDRRTLVERNIDGCGGTCW